MYKIDIFIQAVPKNVSWTNYSTDLTSNVGIMSLNNQINSDGVLFEMEVYCLKGGFAFLAVKFFENFLIRFSLISFSLVYHIGSMRIE